MKFLIINGPNLNLLGKREPGIYGRSSYADLCALIEGYAAQHGSAAHCFQSNHEGAIIDQIHAADGVYDAIIINPGAYTHYSYAILDALKAVSVPAYEVHISHIDRREPFRAISVTAPACVGQLYGLGFDGYLRAMDHFLAAPPRLCVIGDPVAHSKSPRIQSAMLAALGISGSYTAQTVPAGALPAFLAQVRGGAYSGFNATMPHKQALLALVDELDESAARTGSVNTVCLRGEKLVGFSTDGEGFVRALESELGLPCAGQRVTLLGAGGAARSVALALAQAGAGPIFVCNRSPERAQALAALAPEVLVPRDLTPRALQEACASSTLLINATSLGMAGQGEFSDLSFLDALGDGAAVCDLIYHPAQTTLLRRARDLGRSTMNGLPMLVWQGVLALEKFLGRDGLNLSRMAQAAKAALAD